MAALLVALPARAAPRPTSCNRSLEYGDFKSYDVVANGRLHRAELSRTQFRCLVSQLVRTRDRNVRNYFVGAIQNRLWEAVRRALLWARKTERSKAILERIRDLLAYEFSDRVARGDVILSYGFEHDSYDDRSGGDGSRDLYVVHGLKAVASFQVNLTLGQWRWRSSTALRGNQYFSLTRRRTTGSDPGITREERRYSGVAAWSYLALIKRNERFRVQLQSGLERVWNPVADRLTSGSRVAADLSLRQPHGTRVAAKLSTAWRENRYAPPLSADYNTKRLSDASVNGELSYLFKVIGIVGTYSYWDYDIVNSFSTSQGFHHTPFLLGHLRFRGGYFRFGGGAGVWEDRYEQLEDPAATLTRGAKVHGRVELQWQARKWVTATLQITAAGNRSEGDFNGWYPSWSAWAKGTFSWKLISLDVSAGWNGHFRDLDHRQTRHVAWGHTQLAVRPGKGFNLRLTGYGGAVWQTGYQPYEEAWWGVVLAAGCRIVRRPDTWLEVSGRYAGNRYEEPDFLRDRAYFQTSLWGKLRF